MIKGKRFASVWDAIEDTPQQAASMRARSELMMALQGWVRGSGSTQADAARLLGITQPRMSDLMRGKISLFSLDAMMDMATAAGLDPRVTIGEKGPGSDGFAVGMAMQRLMAAATRRHGTPVDEVLRAPPLPGNADIGRTQRPARFGHVVRPMPKAGTMCSRRPISCASQQHEDDANTWSRPRAMRSSIAVTG